MTSIDPHRSRHFLRATSFSMIAAASLSLIGCSGGDGLPRHAVSGRVTFDGQPVEQGRIMFEPTGQQETGSGAVITDGSYEIPRNQGLVPGPYQVAISSAGGQAEATDKAPGAVGAGPGAMMPEQIPAKYNTQTTLTAEVTEDGQNIFNFDLEP